MTQQTHKRKLFTAMALGLLLAVAFPREAKAQMLAVKTNALSWVALTPDIGLEVVVGDHTSVALSAFGTYAPLKNYPIKLVALQPEFRYWFNGRPLTREYIGICGFATTYDLTLPAGPDRANIFKGDAFAIGLSGGYSFSLGKRWNFELSGGTGIMLFRQKQYFEGDNYDEYFPGVNSKPNTWGYKIFPVKLAATFVYIIR